MAYTVHTGETLRLASLVDDWAKPEITNRRFVRCQLEGPAVVFLGGSIITGGVGWGGTVDQVWNVIQGPGIPAGSIAVHDCEFVQCQFLGVGFIGTADAVALAKEHSTD